MARIYKIGLVDDHHLIRKAFSEMISGFEGFSVSLEASNGIELINKVSIIEAADIPDLLIVDINMPQMNGFETVSWIKHHLHETKILIISMHTDEEKVIRLIKMGVNGYLSKDVQVSEIHSALINIIKKGFYYSAFIAEKLLDSIRGEIPGLSNPSALAAEIWGNLNTPEQKLAFLCCSELTYREIADKMGISTKSVEGYRDSLFVKCGVSSRVGLVMFMFRNKLIE